MPWDFWLIFVILGVAIPWRGRVRLRRLLAQPPSSTKEKLVLYGMTIASQWILVGMVAWRAAARGLTAAELGLSQRVTAELAFFAVMGALCLGALQWFNLRRIGRTTGPVPELLRKIAERLLPIKLLEFAPYCALSITAGVCEEFLYRGFAMAALVRVGVWPWAVVVISSLLFGLAHTYQGKSGVFGTTLMGVLFGVFRVVLQSLVPLMAWHAAVDVAAGLAGPKYLLLNREVT